MRNPLRNGIWKENDVFLKKIGKKIFKKYVAMLNNNARNNVWTIIRIHWTQINRTDNLSILCDI